MSGKSPKPVSRRLSDLLGEVRLSGQTWVYGDFAGAAGCAVAPGDAVFVHAVIHGTLRLACTGGAMAELGPGDVAMILSGEAHALRTAPAARAQPHEGLRHEAECDIPPAAVFGEGARIAARVLSARLQARWPGDVPRAALPSLLRTDASLFQPDAMPRSGMGAGSAALLTRIAETLLVAALRTDPGCRRILSSEPRDPIEDALQLIAVAPAQAWTVQSLARAVGMGRSNFAAHFTQAVGKAPMEVVAERRMEHAATLLRQGGMKVAEIAELAGYGSEAAFSRRFSRHFGVTPSQMREDARALRAATLPVPPFRALLAGARTPNGPPIERAPVSSPAASPLAPGRVLFIRARPR